jgi:WD40 repeat protein
MTSRFLLAIALILSLAPGFRAEGRPLELVAKIGDRSDGWMSFVSFSPDGTMVASDGQTPRGRLSLWSFLGGRLLKQLPIQPELMSRDWKYYLSDHSIGAVETGERVLTLPDDDREPHAFSDDGRYLVEAHGGPGRPPGIRVLALPGGSAVREFGLHRPWSVAVSPDGRIMATGHWGVVKLWSLETGERLAVLRGFDRYVVGLAFSRDGKRLAAGTDAGGFQIWDMRHRHRIRSRDFEGLFVSTPTFSPDGRLVAFGVYGTGTVWLVDARSGKVRDHQRVSGLGCGSVAFSPDGRFLIAASPGGVFPVGRHYERGGAIPVFKINAR